MLIVSQDRTTEFPEKLQQPAKSNKRIDKKLFGNKIKKIRNDDKFLSIHVRNK